MRVIRPCAVCAAPVSLKMVSCPHCGAAQRFGAVARVIARAAGVVGGLSITSTLAACYGGPCVGRSASAACRPEVPTCDEVSKQPLIDDKDGDGYCLAQDCNENDPEINVSAPEIVGDGIDQDCDGKDPVITK